MRVNLFYPAVLLVGVALVFLFRPPADTTLNFYGFAESDETAVNYNYPVVVEEILVRPGEAVAAGQVLLNVSRRSSKETLADQDFRVRELAAEETVWRQRKQAQLTELDAELRAELDRLDEQIAAAEAKLTYQRGLTAGLSSITVDTSAFRPQAARLQQLRNQRARAQVQAEERRQGLRQALAVGTGPYRARTDRLRAEAAFDRARQVQPFAVRAPSDGLIGNIAVKPQEHVPSYETLLSFYEPHSSLVRGYVHEDQTLRVRLGDALEVYSLKDPTQVYPGEVTGLGSRIVSIPPRLRKLRDFETYGREIIVTISPANGFLQKEKVGLRLSDAPD